jgi:hypothetical protein
MDWKRCSYNNVWNTNDIIQNRSAALFTKIIWRISPHTVKGFPVYTATKIPFMYSFSGKLRSLSPIFHIHVSVSDLYTFPGSVHIFPAP